MRSTILLAGLTLLGLGQAVIAADADKPIVVAATHATRSQPVAAPAKPAPVVVMATPSKEVPEGSLEKFGSVGLPQ